MGKKIIRLTENELKDVIKESIERFVLSSNCIECEGGMKYPLHEMAYKRKDYVNKAENFAYPLAEHLILLLSAKFQNNEEGLFHYWCTEVYTKYIGVLTLDTLKDNNSKESRKKAIQQGFIQIKDLDNRGKFSSLIITASNREKIEAEKLASMGRAPKPIKIIDDDDLFDRYLDLLFNIIELISEAQPISIETFKEYAS